jgi:succinyldiaminopimelate transaminase
MNQLPDFPWDRLTPLAELARAHPDGLIDLSVGTPVDPTPDVVRRALADATDAPGYPTTIGTARVREAAAGWLQRRFDVTVDAAWQVLPTVGSKELVALLPSLLNFNGAVLFPDLAYPTYDVGARIAGCEPRAVPTVDGLIDVDALDAFGRNASLIWINYPANPHGRIAPAEHLAAVVDWARAHDVLLASDECYIEFAYTARASSVLSLGTQGVLSVHSLSKRSNMAGYRAGLVAGDADVVKRLLEVRKHAGLMVSAPVQAAMAAAFDDDVHVDVQRKRYAERRAMLLPALERSGWQVDHSEGGLYLWVRHASFDDGWAAVEHLAKIGVLVAPGDFYGEAGRGHVRIALTATTDSVRDAATRLETA